MKFNNVKFNPKNYVYSDFKIGSGGHRGWYICDHDGNAYFHKNGTLHSSCGPANFWPSITEAERFLASMYPEIHLPEELFEL